MINGDHAVAINFLRIYAAKELYLNYYSYFCEL